MSARAAAFIEPSVDATMAQDVPFHGALRRRRRDLGVGAARRGRRSPEDLFVDEPFGAMWSLTEAVGARYVYAVPLSALEP